MIPILLFSTCNYKVDKVKKTVINTDSLRINHLSKVDNTLKPYLHVEELDTILINWKKFIENSNYSKNFYNRAIKRRNEINRLKASLQDSFPGREDFKNPTVFKRFILPEELVDFKLDSISSWMYYNKLIKKRRIEIGKQLKGNEIRFFIDEQIHQIIKDSMRISEKYKQIVAENRKKDSVSYLKNYHRINDSLKNIINPIDSILPFGPKSLGNFIANNDNEIYFNEVKGKVLTALQKKKRKDIYDAWIFFLKLHPNSDADLSEGYIEKLLPPTHTYDFVEIDGRNGLNGYLDYDDYQHDFNPFQAKFVTRISNIKNYEVYYTTTGNDFPSGCNNIGKKEDECCFKYEGYDCNSTGNIILYDRKKKHSVIIPAYELNMEELSFMFFYISKDEKIYIFKGDYSYKGGNSISFDSKTMKLEKFYEIKINTDNTITVNKIYSNEFNPLSKEELTKEERNERIIFFKKRRPNYEKSRDSVLKKVDPLVDAYPFGPEVLKSYKFPKEEFEIIITNSDEAFSQPHKEALFEIWSYYLKNRNKKTKVKFLPEIDKFEKINLGTIQQWDDVFSQKYIDMERIFGNNLNNFLTYKFKLPKIGKYEVYYIMSNEGGVSVCNSMFQENLCCNFNCILNGTILFYDRTNRNAHLLNAFSYKSILQQAKFRFFYINSNNQIEIYQGYGDHNFKIDDSRYDKEGKKIWMKKKGKYNIEKTHVINVSENGKIKINQLN